MLDGGHDGPMSTLKHVPGREEWVVREVRCEMRQEEKLGEITRKDEHAEKGAGIIRDRRVKKASGGKVRGEKMRNREGRTGPSKTVNLSHI